MKDMKLRTYFPVILFALVAFAASMRFTARMDWRHTQESRGDVYLGWAASVARGEGYKGCPDDGYLMCEDPRYLAWRLPVYPLFLTTLLAAYGQDDPLPAMRLTQSMLCALTVGLAVGLATRLRGRGVGVIVGVLILAWLPFFGLFSQLMTEALFTPLLLILVYALLYQRRKPFWIGVLIGVLMLTRGTLLFTVPFFAFLFPRRQWARLAVGAMLIIGAWTFRNAVQLHAFVPFSTNGGGTLYGANNADAWNHRSGYYWTIVDSNLYVELPEVERDRAFSRAAFAYLRSQPPARFVEVAIEKLRTLVGL